MKTFHHLKCKVSPHKKLNMSKWIIWNNKLFLATSEEIQTALIEQGVTDYKTITIWRGGEEIQTQTYIFTLNKFIISMEIKSG